MQRYAKVNCCLKDSHQRAFRSNNPVCGIKIMVHRYIELYTADEKLFACGEVLGSRLERLQ